MKRGGKREALGRAGQQQFQPQSGTRISLVVFWCKKSPYTLFDSIHKCVVDCCVKVCKSEAQASIVMKRTKTSERAVRSIIRGIMVCCCGLVASHARAAWISPFSCSQFDTKVLTSYKMKERMKGIRREKEATKQSTTLDAKCGIHCKDSHTFESMQTTR